jgi:hypothetical protein
VGSDQQADAALSGLDVVSHDGTLDGILANPALRSLRDCGVVRAHSCDTNFRALCDKGLAMAVVPMRASHKRDFRLTVSGERVARALPPFREIRN